MKKVLSSEAAPLLARDATEINRTSEEETIDIAEDLVKQSLLPPSWSAHFRARAWSLVGLTVSSLAAIIALFVRSFGV
jgi:hypothetical protein